MPGRKENYTKSYTGRKDWLERKAASNTPERKEAQREYRVSSILVRALEGRDLSEKQIDELRRLDI